MAENPLASFLGAVIVALLVSMLATSNIGIDHLADRIDRQGDRIDRQGDRIDRLEDKVDAGFAAQDAKFDDRFDELDAKFDEMNLKLTALIAKLNATDDVDARGRRKAHGPSRRPIRGAPEPARTLWVPETRPW